MNVYVNEKNFLNFTVYSFHTTLYMALIFNYAVICCSATSFIIVQLTDITWKEPICIYDENRFVIRNACCVRHTVEGVKNKFLYIFISNKKKLLVFFFQNFFNN